MLWFLKNCQYQLEADDLGPDGVRVDLLVHGAPLAVSANDQLHNRSEHDLRVDESQASVVRLVQVGTQVFNWRAIKSLNFDEVFPFALLRAHWVLSIFAEHICGVAANNTPAEAACFSADLVFEINFGTVFLPVVNWVKLDSRNFLIKSFLFASLRSLLVALFGLLRMVIFMLTSNFTDPSIMQRYIIDHVLNNLEHVLVDCSKVDFGCLRGRVR